VDTGVPMETRGLTAAFDPGTGVLRLWGVAKIPHFNRRVLADLLGYPEHLIQFTEMEVGGGFGVRGEFYPEDFLVPWTAKRLGRPVQWIEDRREQLMATNHSRQQYHDGEIGFDRDARIVALVDYFVVDMGAYIRTHGVVVPELTAALLPGPYRIPHYTAEIRCVLTNKTPTGTYRGPGRFEGTFVRERLMDVAAQRLGVDPLELRRKNFIRPDDMPYEVGGASLNQRIVYDCGDYASALDKALAALGSRRRARSGIGDSVVLVVLVPGEARHLEHEVGDQRVALVARVDVAHGAHQGQRAQLAGAVELGKRVRDPDSMSGGHLCDHLVETQEQDVAVGSEHDLERVVVQERDDDGSRRGGAEPCEDLVQVHGRRAEHARQRFGNADGVGKERGPRIRVTCVRHRDHVVRSERDEDRADLAAPDLEDGLGRLDLRADVVLVQPEGEVVGARPGQERGRRLGGAREVHERGLPAAPRRVQALDERVGEPGVERRRVRVRQPGDELRGLIPEGQRVAHDERDLPRSAVVVIREGGDGGQREQEQRDHEQP
jgi:hypothetical protein